VILNKIAPLSLGKLQIFAKWSLYNEGSRRYVGA